MTSSKPTVVNFACSLLAVCTPLTSWAGGAPSDVGSGLQLRAVSKVASCASGDHPEPALQGQVPAAIRANGFEGFNCNLALMSQYAGSGGGVAFANFKDDHGHFCAYYSTGLGAGGSTNVIDVTDPAKAVLTATLKSTAMLNPWESMRVNARRQLLVAVSPAPNGPAVPGMPPAASAASDTMGVVDVYDLSTDCRNPKLLASVAVGTGKDGGILAAKSIQGHDSNFSPDGLTFYSGDPSGKTYSAIDLSDPTKPKLVSNLALETHVPANCSKVLPDLAGEGGFTYGSHICSVDNRENATALACGYWQSGIRVFDIRVASAPKEIAYFNPAPVPDLKYSVPGGTPSSRANVCGAPAGFDFERKLLTTMCMRSGALVLKFENDVWPMPQSTPAPRGISYN